MHEYVLLALGFLLTMALLATLAHRLQIPTPIFLVVGGLLVSLIPGVPRIDLEPDLIFLVFLPPLLYEAAWFTSWRELWRWRRIVLVLAFGLVILTATAVAYTAYWFIPGFTLALGFLLGGIISPPDAVAATSVLRGVDVPKSSINILEGESLINDAASLIVLQFALNSIETGTFVWQQVAVSFVLVTLIGAGVGLGVALVFYCMHRWLPLQLRISVLLTLLAPYTMYLAAEQFHGSGVIAVVSGGLFLSTRSHRLFNHSERLQNTSMWATVIFIINGVVFMVIGLELPVILDELKSDSFSLAQSIGYGLLMSALVIVVRLVFSLAASVFTDFAGRFITVTVRNVGWRGPVVLGWAGMRGVVSLAAALSVPLLLANGTPFPHRPLLLFITFIVILVTLVVQGLTLPVLARWVRPKELLERIPENEQEATIKRQLQAAALRELTQHYPNDIANNPLLTDLKQRLEGIIFATQLSDSEEDQQLLAMYREARDRMHLAKRNELMRLARQAEIDKEILMKAEAQLDLEEEKIDHPMR
ncbi:Na+/H+ antiporter [Fibrella arboris]|uniref:Na+/H+ antiporter n=1 Tax=Fibrella arboris TaxID=3242486 RepID=UPI0035213137